VTALRAIVPRKEQRLARSGVAVASVVAAVVAGVAAARPETFVSFQ
jgi:hypothetical protein